MQYEMLPPVCSLASERPTKERVSAIYLSFRGFGKDAAMPNSQGGNMKIRPGMHRTPWRRLHISRLQKLLSRFRRHE